MDAARDQLLSGRPFTIDSIARRAAVTRATVYAQFADREHLRDAVFDRLAETGGLGRIPEAFTQLDAVSGLRTFVEIFCTFYTTHRAVLRKLNALAVLETTDEIRSHRRNERRRQGLTVLLTRVAHERSEFVDLCAAISLVHALTSFEFFDQIADDGESATVSAERIFVLVRAALHL